MFDSLSAIQLSHNPVFHGRTKHVEIDFHIIRKCVVRKDMKLCYVPTEKQLVDLFTKPQTSPRLQFFCSKLLSSQFQFEGG